MGYRRYYEAFSIKKDIEKDDNFNEKEQIKIIEEALKIGNQYLLGIENIKEILKDIFSKWNKEIFWFDGSKLNGRKSYFLINVNNEFNEFLKNKNIYNDGCLLPDNDFFGYFNGMLIIKTIDLLEWFYKNYIVNKKYKNILGNKLSYELEWEMGLKYLNENFDIVSEKLKKIPFHFFESAYGYFHVLKGNEIYSNKNIKFWYSLTELLNDCSYSDYIILEEY